MDIKRFELTDEGMDNQELREKIDNLVGEAMSAMGCELSCIKAETQTLENKEQIVTQILSLFEPVELEALGDEEQKEIINLNRQMGNRHFYEAGKRLAQATIQQNQSKGQLYRIREAK